MIRLSDRSAFPVMIAYSFLTAASQILWVTYMPITTAVSAQWGVSVDAVGWMSEVFPLLYVLLALPFGYWADRHFKRSLAVGALIIAAGACIRMIPGYEGSLAGQILIAAGQPLVLNAINKLAAQYIAPSKRPAAIAAGTASQFVGILLSSISTPFILQWRGIQMVLLLQAVFAAAAAAAMLFALRKSPLYKDESEAPISIRKVWSSAWIKWYSLLLAAGFGLFVTLTTWLEVISEPIGISSEQVGIGIGVMTFAGILGAAFIPDWASRGRRGSLAICASLAANMVLFIALAAGLPLWLYMSLLALTGCLLLANLPIVLASAESRSEPGTSGTVVGILFMCGNLGGIVLSLCVQLILGHRLAALLLLLAVAALLVPVAIKFPFVQSDRSPDRPRFQRRGSRWTQDGGA